MTLKKYNFQRGISGVRIRKFLNTYEYLKEREDFHMCTLLEVLKYYDFFSPLDSKVLLHKYENMNTDAELQ